MALSITTKDLKRFFPRGHPDWLEPLAIMGPDLAAKHGITTIDCWRMFMAQVAAETDGLSLKHMRENMHYSAARIQQVFDFRLRKAQRENPMFKGQPLSEIARRLAGNPSLLAETVYGDRRELGNTRPGDGARYFGRGPLQTTGRDWYAKLSPAAGVDLVAEPHRMEEPYVAWKATFAEWEMLGCSALVPRGVEAVSRRVNGGTNGMARRRAEYHRASVIWTDADVSAVAANDSGAAEVTPRHAEVLPETPTAAALAANGSRSMTWLQRGRNWMAGTGLTTVSFFGIDTFGGFRNTLNELKSLMVDHALVLALLAIGTCITVIVLAQHYLVKAAEEGRYSPRDR